MNVACDGVVVAPSRPVHAVHAAKSALTEMLPPFALGANAALQQHTCTVCIQSSRGPITGARSCQSGCMHFKTKGLQRVRSTTGHSGVSRVGQDMYRVVKQGTQTHTQTPVGVKGHCTQRLDPVNAAVTVQATVLGNTAASGCGIHMMCIHESMSESTMSLSRPFKRHQQ